MLVHSNYWDLARATEQERARTRVAKDRGFPDAYLESWQANLTAWVELVQKNVPKVGLAGIYCSSGVAERQRQA